MIRLLDGVYSWSWFSPEKRFNFNGHILKTQHGTVIVDPVALTKDDLAYIEAAGLKPDALVITNRNHLQVTEIDVFLRHALDVSGSNGRNLLRVGVPVVRGQVVKLLRDDVLQQCPGLFQRKREATNDRALRVVELFG